MTKCTHELLDGAVEFDNNTFVLPAHPVPDAVDRVGLSLVVGECIAIRYFRTIERLSIHYEASGVGVERRVRRAIASVWSIGAIKLVRVNWFYMM